MRRGLVSPVSAAGVTIASAGCSTILMFALFWKRRWFIIAMILGFFLINAPHASGPDP